MSRQLLPLSGRAPLRALPKGSGGAQTRRHIAPLAANPQHDVMAERLE